MTTRPITVVSVSFKNCLEKAPEPEVAVAVGDEVPIMDVIIDVDVSLPLDAADDCVDEDELLVPVDVELAASGEVRASAAQAVVLAVCVPT